MEKAVTIGTFDGVHRGHRLVLDTLKKEAGQRNLQPTAISFPGHPLELIAPERAPGNLLTPDRKVRLLKDEGVTPILLPFNERLRKMTAYEWMLHLYRKYDVRLLVAGYDNTFGCDGIDLTIADYRTMGDTIGIEVISAPEVPGVSSSRIRKAVKAGDIGLAAELLGREPENVGRVRPGFHLGSKIGYPTANLEIEPHSVLPPTGVYAAIAKTANDPMEYPAMVNIGYRPTFNGTTVEASDMTVEAHLIGADRDLYGTEIRLSYVARLRDEIRFPSVDKLIKQLDIDREETLRLIAEASDNNTQKQS